MPCSNVAEIASNGAQVESDSDCNVDSTSGLDLVQESNSLPVGQKWHEAVFILSIKEKHFLPQIAIDNILSTVSIFVSEILWKLFEDIHDSLTSNTMQLLESKIKLTSDDLFKGLTTAFLQKKYFKENFGLIVS